MYIAIKYIHITAVILSFSLFFLRGLWMISDSSLRQQRWIKIVPHVIDTILLTSAIALTVIIRQYPFVSGWLTAKVLALMVYIGLGMMALKWGKTRKSRMLAWALALLVFGYIVAVALGHSPRPFLG